MAAPNALSFLISETSSVKLGINCLIKKNKKSIAIKSSC